MNIKSMAAKAAFMLRKNSPVLLTGSAIVGTGLTAYLSAMAGRKHVYEMLDRDPVSRKEELKLVWKFYIPPTVSGVGTVACMVGANRVGMQRTAAAQAGLVLAERTYSEYRDKVIDQFGERTDKNIREEVAKDRVRDNQPPAPDILVTGPGNVLSCELYTGRYFASDMETLRRAMNTLNAQLISRDRASLEDFYDLIGLGETTGSELTGWTSDRMMELEFTTVLTEDGRPCLAFQYNYTRPLYERYS